MADRPIPARSEVPEESTWNLRDVFESDEAWQAEYEALKAVPEQIEAFRGRLGESAETLLEWFRLNDALSVRLEKLYGYASCKGDEDTGNGFYQGMRSKALATLVAIDAASAFETPEIMALDEDTVNLFYAAQPELETYRRNIYKIRRRKAHILSPEEEKLLSAAGEMANAPENIASVFRDADLTFPTVTDGEGNERVLTSGRSSPCSWAATACCARTPLKPTITVSVNLKILSPRRSTGSSARSSSSRTRGTIPPPAPPRST